VTALSVPAIDRALADARRHFSAGRSTVAFVGPPTAGKSAALRHLAQAMAEGPERRRVVAIDFPRHGDDDAAMVALANAAGQLEAVGCSVAEQVRDPKVTFGTKLDSVVAALEETENLLVTIDMPRLDRNPSPTMGMFREATWTTFHRLASLKKPLVAVAADRKSAWPAASPVQLRTFSDPDALLAPDQWNGLGASAQTARQVFGDHLNRFSPQMVRLGVVALHLGASAEKLSEAVLARHLLSAVCERLSPTARTVLGRLGHVRVPFDNELLERVGWEQMAAEEQTAVHAGLLLQDQGALHLHEDIARAVRSQRGESEFDEGHRAIASWHRAAYEIAVERSDVRGAIHHEVELVHHLSETGDADALEHAYFAEQYDAFGKSLSIAGRFDDAVRAYERALEHQPDDAYAHHYLAYNLDVQGKDAPRVDRHYGCALNNDPGHVWYHGRRLCFFVVRGRDADARRAWNDALVEFMPDVTQPDEDFYKELHGHFARILLHRGKLELAHEVLCSVPRDVAERATWWRALKELERGLADAHARELVFPPHLDEEERWSGPHLAPTEGLERWMPGRVDAVDDEGVTFRIAARQSDEPVRYGHRRMSWQELGETKRWGREGFATGRFVEIYELDDGTTRVERWPPEKPPKGLLPLRPPPDRYIRRAFARQAD
jgi:tetratricopeptide (TPR) repeat protein